MFVSVEQYRCAIGMYSAGRVHTQGKGSFSFVYKVNLTDVFKTVIKQTNDNNSEHSWFLMFMFLLVILVILAPLTLAMHIENSYYDAVTIGYRNVNIHSADRMFPSPSFGLISYLNWAIIIILFQSSKTRGISNSSFVKLFLNFKKCKKNTFMQSLSNKYTFYTTMINLILIVIVTPSIVNPGPVSNNSNKSLSIAYCNAQGLILMSSMKCQAPIFQTNKLLELQSFIHLNSPDLIIINETWLNDRINSNEIVNEQFYKTFRLDRTAEDKLKYGKVGGGGLLMLVKQNLKIETKLVDIKTWAPILSIEIKFEDSSKLCLSSFYRYGYSSTDMYDEANRYYRAVCKKYNKVVIIGDINLASIKDWENPLPSCRIEESYVDLFNDLGLKCLVNQSTHKGGNILDLLMCNQPGIVSNLSIDPDKICCSDHYSFSFEISRCVSKKKPPKKRIFNYRKANWDGLNQELHNINWYDLFQGKCIYEAWEIFKSKLDISMRKFIPMSNVRFKRRPPWFDDEIQDICKNKDRLRKKAKSSSNPDDIGNFRKYRVYFKQMVSKKKQEFIAADPCENSDDVVNKRFWSFVKSNNKSSRIPESVHYNGRYRSETSDQCDLFNKFFCDQFSDCSTYNIDSYDSTDTNNSNNLRFTPGSIYYILRNVKPNKAPGPDNISGHVLKNCANTLKYPLSQLYNKSYHSGRIPEDWKAANVVPIHKKGPKDSVENYRPVSLTSLIMKVFEKCIRDTLIDLCREQISPSQHGFLPTRSCTTQMVSFTDSLALNLNAKGQTDIIYFDFAKAFDSVNHDVILEKLRYKFGIKGKLLNFFIDYLSGRKQRVVIDNNFSSFSPVRSGVPQGSILGPLLFVLFINDIIDELDKDTHILMYADDTKIWREICSIEDQHKLQSDIDALYAWSVKNKIRFHPNKCKAMRISLKRNKFEYNYALNGNVLAQSESECDLGITVSHNLKWNRHHSVITCKAAQKLGLVKRVCSFTLNKFSRKILFLSIVRSQFEHCSVVWAPTTSSQLLCFERILKRGIKWIFNEEYISYSDNQYLERLKELDILPMYLKFRHNDLVLFHKIMYNLVPIDFPEYIIISTNSDSDRQHYYQRQTRNFNDSDKLKVKSKVTPLIEAFKHSFFQRTYSFWNSLPFRLRSIDCSDSFRIKLKEHLWLTAEENLGTT